MANIELQRAIKQLGTDIRNGSALVELMDYCNVSNLRDVPQYKAEIFYILYNGLVNNTINLTNIKVIRRKKIIS